jgi:hypothetical protein
MGHYPKPLQEFIKKKTVYGGITVPGKKLILMRLFDE